MLHCSATVRGDGRTKIFAYCTHKVESALEVLTKKTFYTSTTFIQDSNHTLKSFNCKLIRPVFKQNFIFEVDDIIDFNCNEPKIKMTKLPYKPSKKGSNTPKNNISRQTSLFCYLRKFSVFFHFVKLCYQIKGLRSDTRNCVARLNQNPIPNTIFCDLNISFGFSILKMHAR